MRFKVSAPASELVGAAGAGAGAAGAGAAGAGAANATGNLGINVSPFSFSCTT